MYNEVSSEEFYKEAEKVIHFYNKYNTYGIFEYLINKDKFKDLNNNNNFKTRIYLGTDVIESSITLPDIYIVIDLGLKNKVTYNPIIDDTLNEVSFINKTNAGQRKGRTGRRNDGLYYHLYNENNLNKDIESKLETDDLAFSLFIPIINSDININNLKNIIFYTKPKHDLDKSNKNIFK